MDHHSTRVDFVTPLPPLATEIANHSALVLAALARQADVVAWTDQPAWDPLECEVRGFSIHEVPVAELSTAQATFYNIGNNIRFHAAIWEASRRSPGIVILHDTMLQDFFQGFTNSHHGASEYVAMMRGSHGLDGEAAAIDRVLHERGDINEMASRYPMTRAAVEGSRGVIVHNEGEVARLQRLVAAPVWYVPLAGHGSHAALPAIRGANRLLHLIVFGHLNANRRVVEIVRALGSFPGRDRYRLDVYGEVLNAQAVLAEIAAHGLQDRVRLHGYVPAAELDAALAGADLALNLRHPTMGEASSSQVRIWANALPSLVTPAGWYAGLAPELVGFVDPTTETADLHRHLAAFADDPAPYISAGVAGRSHANAVHSAEAYATALIDIAGELARPPVVTARPLSRARRKPRPGLAATSAKALRHDGGVRRSGAASEPAAEATLPTLHLDMTDLMHYTSGHRGVSGIQRVQIGIIGQWLRSADRGGRLGFSIYSTESQRFHALDHADMVWLVDSLSRETQPDSRMKRVATLVREAAALAVLAPRDGDTLMVTGNFWSFPGFHPALRQMQSDGLRYVQVYYDAVPTVTPEHCPYDSVLAYNRALVHMLSQADAVCAISHHAAGELRMLAGRLGLACPATKVVPLGTRPHYGDEVAESEADADLPPHLGDFVLCVGTIEPRKNHLYLFHLWRRLLARTGRPTPKLVCAGRLGWLTEDLQRHLHASRDLDGHFVILSEVSDAQLRALYRRCRFTIYPSVYEGWGLPVSESLSASRLCVTSRVSAMPEAGGRWAAYLDPFDLGSGLAVVADLIDHPDKVAAAEAAIRGSYRAISWAEAADTLWTTVDGMLASAGDGHHRFDTPPLLPTGHQHRLRLDLPTVGPLAIAREELAAAAFGVVLHGRDWNIVERWGVWARGVVARLNFQTEIIEDDELIVYIRLGMPNESTGNEGRIDVNGRHVSTIGLHPGLQTVRVPLGRGGRVRLDMTLAREERATGDARHLGLGLHRLFVCRARDTAARLAFLEDC